MSRLTIAVFFLLIIASSYAQQNNGCNVCGNGAQQQQGGTSSNTPGYLPDFQGDQYTDPKRIQETQALNAPFFQSIGGKPSYPGGSPSANGQQRDQGNCACQGQSQGSSSSSSTNCGCQQPGSSTGGNCPCQQQGSTGNNCACSSSPSSVNQPMYQPTQPNMAQMSFAPGCDPCKSSSGMGKREVDQMAQFLFRRR